MRGNKLTIEQEKEIVEKYFSGEIPMIEKLALTYKVGKLKINSILLKYGVEKRKRGSQSKDNITIRSNDRYKKRFLSKLKNEKIIAKCKLTNKEFNDYLNSSGILSEHILKHYSNVIIPNNFSKKKYFLANNKYWHEQYFDIIKIKDIGNKNFEAISITNERGSNLLNHNTMISTKKDNKLDWAKNIEMSKYLNETKLGEELKIIFPNFVFIHNKCVPNSELRTRPDYRCDELKLIIEFDGDRHYREAQKIKREEEKNEAYTQMGYNVIRIPYFVQLSTEVIKNLFDKDVEYIQTYPHGFISPTVIMPTDFCELGIEKFKLDLKRFKYIETDILHSLINKVKELNDKDFVIPKSLNYLLDDIMK